MFTLRGPDSMTPKLCGLPQQKNQAHMHARKHTSQYNMLRGADIQTNKKTARERERGKEREGERERERERVRERERQTNSD